MSDTVVRRVQLGTVVEHHPTRHAPHPERGVVTWAYGRGVKWPTPMFADDHYIIRKGAGITVHGNLDEEWTEVPHEDWTTEERVRCAIVAWETPNWYPEGEEPQDNDTWIFAAIRAMLTDGAVEEVFPEDGDWPTSIEELLLAVARWLDHRERALRTLGRAEGRLR